MNLAANRFRLGLSRPTFDSIRWHRRCRDFIVPTTSNNLRCQTSQFPHVQIFEYPDGSQGAAQYFNVLKRTFPTSPRVEGCDISTPTSTTRRDKGRPTFREIKMERFVLIFHCLGYCFVGFLIVRFLIRRK